MPEESISSEPRQTAMASRLIVRKITALEHNHCYRPHSRKTMQLIVGTSAETDFCSVQASSPPSWSYWTNPAPKNWTVYNVSSPAIHGIRQVAADLIHPNPLDSRRSTDLHLPDREFQEKQDDKPL